MDGQRNELRPQALEAQFLKDQTREVAPKKKSNMQKSHPIRSAIGRWTVSYGNCDFCQKQRGLP